MQLGAIASISVHGSHPTEEAAAWVNKINLAKFEPSPDRILAVGS